MKAFSLEEYLKNPKRHSFNELVNSDTQIDFSVSVVLF